MKRLLESVFQGRDRRRVFEDVYTREPLFMGGFTHSYIRYRLSENHEPAGRWQRCLLSIEHAGVHLYPWSRRGAPHYFYPCETLRWFGRPNKYTNVQNEMWMHFQVDSSWVLLSVITRLYAMKDMVRAMKQIATPEQNIAYRRRRPYIHLGPISAYAAEQDLYGAWTVTVEESRLYVMPLYVVIMDDQSSVQRLLPLEQIQNIEAMRRLDTGPQSGSDGRGIVRFRYHDEVIAFKVPDYIGFAESLAEAAKRTLEKPPVFYGKKKLEDEDE